MIAWILFTGCSPAPVDSQVTAAERTTPEPTVPDPGAQMSKSPAGDVHPGTVVFDDKVDGERKERAAGELPSTIAWFERDGTWIPVTRIEITGSKERRRMTSFGPDGDMLETTVRSR